MPRGPEYQKERGERQMNRVLELLTGGPMTSHQLSDAMHLARTNVIVAINRLKQRPNRRVYTCSFELKSGRPRHIFALGSKNDMTVEKFQMARLVDCLEDEACPWSMARAVEVVGMNYGTVKMYMRALKAKGKVHIAAWDWSDRTSYPLYMIGKGDDAPRPTSKPLAVRATCAPAGIFYALGL